MWGLKRKDETRRPPRRGPSALVRDRRGATIVEFAAVAAPFIALILAILQTSIVFFSQQTLETTAEKTARAIMTGQLQSAGIDQDQFKKLACKNLPAFMDCANLLIDVQTATLSDINTTIPVLTYDDKGNITNTWSFNPGSSGDIVVMRTMYRLPVINAPLGFDLANQPDGKRLLVATSVFVNEPYATGAV